MKVSELMKELLECPMTAPVRLSLDNGDITGYVDDLILMQIIFDEDDQSHTKFLGYGNRNGVIFLGAEEAEEDWLNSDEIYGEALSVAELYFVLAQCKPEAEVAASFGFGDERVAWILELDIDDEANRLTLIGHTTDRITMQQEKTDA